MMGLMLHANGKALMKREQYRDALEVLNMGEVSLYCFMHEDNTTHMELICSSSQQ